MREQEEVPTAKAAPVAVAIAEYGELDEQETSAPESEPAPVISLRNVGRVYESQTGERVEALRNVSLDIHPGEFVVIRGESGSGKTTLLRILGLLDNDFSGEYALGGTSVPGQPGWWLDEARSANIGFVFQEGRLFDHLTLERNVTVPYRLAGGRSRGAELTRELHEEAEHFFSGQEFDQSIFAKSPQKVSGGQRQRIAIMRAIKRRPPIILADEPTASLDSKRKKAIVELLKDACRQGHTVIVVSHDSIFFDTGRQFNIEGGVLTELPPGRDGFAVPDAVKPVQTDFSSLNTWIGFRPRADLITLMLQTLQETIGRPVFLFLILIALLAGVCQLSIFASLMKGTQAFVEASIKSGSRLNRVEIKPRQSDRENAALFPERETFRSKPAVEAVVGRRESTTRLLRFDGERITYPGMGLQQDDPEYKQLYFYAGGRFSSDVALEIIVTAGLINDLFDTKELQEGRETYASFIGRPVTIRVPQFTDTYAERRTIDVKLKIAGIIAAGEGGRQLYLPLTTALVIDQVKRDRSGNKPLPFNAAGDGWALDEAGLRAFADFAWEDRLQIYTVAMRDVIPLFGELAQLGYRPQSDIWKFKWVLDIRDLAIKIFVPMLILIVLGVGLTVFTNIYASAKMREKDFALWRILGMRTGDLAFTQLLSIIIIVSVGTLSGLVFAASLVDKAREFLLASAHTENQPETTKNLEMIFSPILEFAPYIFIGALGVGILAAIIPAIRAAYTDPAKILQSG